MKFHKEEENTMQLPKEMKGSSCTHEPTEWTECARCIENHYLEQLATGDARREQARQRIARETRSAREALALRMEGIGFVLESARAQLTEIVAALKAETPNPRTDARTEGLPVEEVAWHFMECYGTVKLDEGVIERGRRRWPLPAEPRPFTRLRELVHVREAPDTDGLWCMWRGSSTAFSVLKGTPGSVEATPDEAVESVLLAVLNELEAQKAALELRAMLAETERDALKARAVLDAAAWKSADEVLDETRRELYQERQARVQAERAPAGFRARRLGSEALTATAPKHVDGRPCWCQVSWVGLRLSNHGEGCERLTALLHEMIKEEEKTP